MKIGTVLRNIAYVVKYVFRISPMYIIIVLMSSIISSMVVLINLSIMKLLFDSVFVVNSVKNAIGSIALSIALTLLTNLMSALIGKYFTPYVLEKTRKKIYLDLYDKTSQFGLENYDDTNFYNDYYYVIDTAENSICGLISLLGTSIAAVLSSTGLIAYLSQTDFSVLFISLLGVCVSCIASLSYKRQQHCYELALIPERRMQNYINRIFYLKDFAKEIRVYPNKMFFEKYEESYEKKQKLNRSFGKRLSVIGFLHTSVQSLSGTAILIVLVLKAFKGAITVSDFIVNQNGAQQLTSQLTTLFNLLPSFYENSLRITKYRQFMDRSTTEQVHTLSKDDFMISRIHFNNVCYNYISSEFHLNNISFDFSRGEKIAIVGPNGAGKSTIAKLICGFYKPKGGEIEINNCKASNAIECLLGTHIGAVFQDYQLFAFSIAENILMRPVSSRTLEEDLEKVENALKFVGLYEKVKSFPQGINTVLTREFSAEGRVFSGGELQRLALARVFAQNYDVIVFDEITSSVDPISESQILALISDLAKEKIVFFVSHRLLNMKQMDMILYVSGGQIKECGTHQQLMEQNGEYAKMFNIQADKYVNTSEG